MRLTIKHYYCFGANSQVVGERLINRNSWDQLRVSANDSQCVFVLPKDRALWEERCQRDSLLQKRAEAIGRILGSGFDRIHSYGVGCAYLEFLIKKNNPAISIRCSDYTPQAIERLRVFFPEAEVICFNMLEDSWQNINSRCLHLLYRVDTELSDKEWMDVFEKMSRAGVQQVLFVPSEFLTLKSLLTQKIKYGISRLLGRRMAWAGYLRTYDQFKALIDPFYRIKDVKNIGEIKGFLLELKTQDVK